MKLIQKRVKISQSFGVIIFGYYLMGASFWSLKNAILGEVLYFIGTIMVAVGVLGRVWCLSYIAGNKRNIVIQHGPYSLCRNPLYLFGLIGAIGIGLTTKTIALPLIIFIVFVTYYPFVVKKEENDLRLKFGTEFENYMNKTTSRIIPSFQNYADLERTKINLRSFRKGVFDLFYFIIPLGIFPFIEFLHGMGAIPYFYYIF